MLIAVRRQPQDYRTAFYNLEDFDCSGWDNISGGVKAQMNDYYICGYVQCDKAVDGAVAHRCDNDKAPHRLKVCVIKKYSDKEAYKQLLDELPEKPKWEKLK